MDVKISDSIVYIGVDDKDIDLFESQYVVPNGVSYNSYVILDEKIAVMDTADMRVSEKWFANLSDALGERTPDYLVISHLEPDHAGNIQKAAEKYPEMKLVVNAKSAAMLPQFFDVDAERLLIVKEGEELSLGEHTLQFFMAPMVHWPETMVTYDETEKILFSGDAFGCFGALNGGIIDTEINCETFWLEMVRYYSNIVGKYGIPVQNALKKLAGVELDYICSTHGPVWHEHIEKVIGMYDKMSKYETEPGLVICYGTMYGNTERMAEIIARAASKAGVKNIVMYNISKTHHSYILRDIFRYRGLIVGAPTYNAGLYHEMEVLLSELANKDVKNHLLGWYGSHCWASKAVAKIQEWNDTKLHYEPVGEPVDMKQAITPEVKAQCEALGKAMAEKLLAE